MLLIFHMPTTPSLGLGSMVSVEVVNTLTRPYWVSSPMVISDHHCVLTATLVLTKNQLSGCVFVAV